MTEYTLNVFAFLFFLDLKDLYHGNRLPNKSTVFAVEEKIGLTYFLKALTIKITLDKKKIK